MNRNSPITMPPPQDRVSSRTELADNPFLAPGEADLEYQPGTPLKTVRIKARIRSITAGKPLRYDLPNLGPSAFYCFGVGGNCFSAAATALLIVLASGLSTGPLT